MSTPLDDAFFDRSAIVVARALLGKCLVRRTASETIVGQIHETEAYVGPHDLACHARVGRTARTAVMYGAPGHWYVYLIYGMYSMLNVVTGPGEHASAVLIRGVGPWTGPGKLTRAMSIDRALNTLPIAPASGLWVEDRGVVVPRAHIERTARIGVDYAGIWRDKPLRFVIRKQFRET